MKYLHWFINIKSGNTRKLITSLQLTINKEKKC